MNFVVLSFCQDDLTTSIATASTSGEGFMIAVILLLVGLVVSGIAECVSLRARKRRNSRRVSSPRSKRSNQSLALPRVAGFFAVALFMVLGVGILTSEDGLDGNSSTSGANQQDETLASLIRHAWGSLFHTTSEEKVVARRVTFMPVSDVVTRNSDGVRRVSVSTHYAPPTEVRSQTDAMATATSGANPNLQTASASGSSATHTGFSDYEVGAPTVLPARNDAEAAVRAEELTTETLVKANDMSSRAYAPEPNSLRGVNKIKLESYIATDRQRAEVERALSRFTPEKPLIPQPQNVAGSSSSSGVRSTSFETNGQFDILEAGNRARHSAYEIAKRSVLPIFVKDVENEAGKRGDVVGSGLLASSDNEVYLLTSAHIVANASNEKIAISLPNGEKITPSEVYCCDDFDIAVLLLDSAKLPQDGSVTTCCFVDDSALQIGDEVFTVGSPLGLNSSVVYGYVSALGRRKSDLDANPKNNLPIYIQIDSSINSGNSGGPLFSVRSGSVGAVGIVSDTAAKSGIPLGVGFAIPISVAVRVADSLIENKGWTRFKLGVELVPTTIADLRGVDATAPMGVKIVDVCKGSVAAKLGVKANDVVLIYNGVKVQDDAHFRHMIALSRQNDPIHMSVLRKGQLIELSSESTVRQVTYSPR